VNSRAKQCFYGEITTGSFEGSIQKTVSGLLHLFKRCYPLSTLDACALALSFYVHSVLFRASSIPSPPFLNQASPRPSLSQPHINPRDFNNNIRIYHVSLYSSLFLFRHHLESLILLSYLFVFSFAGFTDLFSP
jgi:hypothetical protein